MSREPCTVVHRPPTNSRPPCPPCAAGRVVNRTYGRRVALHEAGHFLVAYLLGLLPRAYTLSSLDLFIRCAAALEEWLPAGRCGCTCSSGRCLSFSGTVRTTR